MKLIEILKAQGLTDDQISKITNSMKENKIYETSLENADDEYSKLKTKKENLEGQLNTANTTIGDLKKDNAINSKLSKVDDKYKKLLRGQFDRDKLIVKEDGSIEGLEDQFKTISETYIEWFEPETPNNSGGLGNFNRNHGGGANAGSIGERLAKQVTEGNAKKYDYFGGIR